MKINININTSTEDQISICQQFLGYKWKHHYFDAAESFMNLPLNPSSSAAPVVRRADVEWYDFIENYFFLATNAESCDRPPRCMQSTFVENLRHWVVNKHDDMLEVCSPAQIFRKKWTNTKGMEANFSKRKLLSWKWFELWLHRCLCQIQMQLIKWMKIGH